MVDPSSNGLEAELHYHIAERITLLHVSDSLIALLGYPADSFMSGAVSLAACLHADDQDIAVAMFSPEQTDVLQVTNLRLRHANGRIRCVKATYLKQHPPDGNGIVLKLLLQDAKSLVRTMGDPAAMVNFRAMMENTDDYIYFKDRNHVFTGASQALVTLCHPAEHWTDLLGQTDYDVFPEEYADIYYRLEKQVFAGTPVAHEIQKYLTKDGKKGWVDNRKYPIKDSHGTLIGLYGIARDVTEQMQAEAALSASEAKYRELVENANSIILKWNRRSEVLFLNEYGQRFFGYSEQEIVGQSVIGTIVPLLEGTGRDLALLMNEIFADPDKYAYNINENMRKDGSRVWISWSNKPIVEADGCVTSMFSVGTDITERKLAEHALREAHAKYEHLVENIGSEYFFYVHDTQNVLTYVSASVTRMLGWRTDELLTHYSKLLTIHPLNQQSTAYTRAGLRGEKQPPYLVEVWHQDGSTRWLEVNETPIISKNGQVLGLEGIAHDITAAKQAEESLCQAASVFEHAREGIMITDPHGHILDVNRAFTCITGYSRGEVLGQNPRLLKSGRHEQDFYAAIWQALKEKGHWHGEVWNRHKNGGNFAVLQTISTVHGKDGEILRYVSLFSDITAIKEHQKQLEYLAHFDALTGLPNRVLLADRLHQAMSQVQRHGTRLAVVYLDLDGFKAINDTHGHETGDKFLAALATRMKQSLRDGDTLSRLGGDEFVAVLLDLQVQEASLPVLHRLLTAAAEAILVDGLELRVSASLGVTFFPQAEEMEADQLLRQADQAMYLAKQSGKSRYHFFDDEHDRTVRSHHESLGRIHQALKKHEFTLYYQPKVNMRTGQIIGAEALIRWRHPERGLLPPADFLPMIEGHSLIVEIEEWVLEKVLCQIESWRRAGLVMPVSVNIDAQHLQQPNFVSRLHQQLTIHPEIQPGDLELEVLETNALKDVARVTEIILACGKIGVGFALDDFGTGYSSLTYLKRLPAYLLKIDQSFVRGMLNDPEDQAILEGVLGLASAFRRRVIAEGVETLAHGKMLLRLGCELGQGYAIAQPMPAEIIPHWLAHWRSGQAWLNPDKAPDPRSSTKEREISEN